MKKGLFFLSLIFIVIGSCFFFFDKPLRNVPFSDEMILRSKNIIIDGLEYILNGSIIDYDKNSYLMVFRYPKDKKSYIGLVKLDKSFNQIEPFLPVNVLSNEAEDPRIFSYNNNFFLSLF